ncbi:hypothetical protein Z517_09423 [Fonsecaea pedrosoi CBS 271.37]|uniref:Uncharacterized protein n=1 Tax=Fonsecaea pedrosoi CBS 271.37 TaxID=1442368 RepID=A0A0D2GXD5_9EURO|nr:uncharacterized protein Z517_09423 [Fonsecaea pedrosoi CBS 271.37]KIW76979.1 hypothetical protein Z517_09423 [Fonsecaea pedrosoi CBS 271.37]
MDRLPHRPEFSKEKAILALIGQMRQEIRERFAAMEHGLAATRQHVENLATRITASDLNNIARIQNTHLRTADDPLTPLVSPSTGAAIPGFPATSADIDKMSGDEMDALLQRLDLHSAGSDMAEKIKRLRTFIGLRAERLLH